MNLLANISLREKDLWAELLINVLVSLYYFPRMFDLMNSGEDVLGGQQMAALVSSTIVVAIVVAIIVYSAIHISGNVEQKDERDFRFAAQGSLVAHITLTVCIVAIINLVVTMEFFPVALEQLFLELSPLVMAHLLLLSLMLSSVIKTSVQLFHYRRSF